MKKFYLFILILCCTSIGHAQDSNRVKGYRILITPTQFFFYDFPISYEKIIGKFNLGISASYKKSTRNSGEIEPDGSMCGYSYGLYPISNPFYDGANFELNAKYYHRKRRDFFIEVVLFTSYYWFDNKYTKCNNVEGYSFDGLRTESQELYGFKLLVGQTESIYKKNKHAIVFEYFAGLGLRYTSKHYSTQFGTVNEKYYDYKYDEFNYYYPVMHTGLKIGYMKLKNR